MLRVLRTIIVIFWSLFCQFAVDSQLLTHAFGGTYALVPYNAPTLAGLQTIDITPHNTFAESGALQWEQFNEEFNQHFQFYTNGDLRRFLDEVAITEALIAVDIITAGTGSTTLRGASLMKAAKGGKELFNFSTKTAEHMANPGRAVPVQILEQAIKGSKGLADPRGSRALMHTPEMFKNGKAYNLEVLYDKATNSIWNFKYSPIKP